MMQGNEKIMIKNVHFLNLSQGHGQQRESTFLGKRRK